jgi:hypothetical protein
MSRYVIRFDTEPTSKLEKKNHFLKCEEMGPQSHRTWFYQIKKKILELIPEVISLKKKKKRKKVGTGGNLRFSWKIRTGRQHWLLFLFIYPRQIFS